MIKMEEFTICFRGEPIGYCTSLNLSYDSCNGYAAGTPILDVRFEISPEAVTEMFQQEQQLDHPSIEGMVTSYDRRTEE
jgi:hypothetical protein